MEIRIDKDNAGKILAKFLKLDGYKFEIHNHKFSFFKRIKNEQGYPQNNIEALYIFTDGTNQETDIIIDVLLDIGVTNVARFSKDILSGINVGASDYSSITYDKQANNTTFLFGMEDNYNTVDLEFYQVVVLFQKYLESIKKFVDEYASEEKEKEWYKDFLIQLKKLNSVEVTEDINPEDMKKNFID